MDNSSKRETTRCYRCGALLAGNELAGNCPRCLATALLSPDTPEPANISATPVLRRLGDYELLEEVARGGMGVVFRARQVSLRREVAVKVLRDAWLATPVQVKRFRAEAANAAKLKHPNIVAVHDVGEQGGQHFFAMDLVRGQNLAEATREGPLPPRRAAELVARIARAVQHAHEEGVLHRDLKPSNVLLDSHGEPHVTDFGLARPMDDESSLTLTGQVLGTPGYIAPEQAKGGGVVGPAADVYGLGALLFHLLTGRAPFVSASTAETLTQVLQQEPLSPQLLNPVVPVDLAAVCLNCLAKAPRERYGSSQQLAADLELFLEGRTTHARPAGAVVRLQKWARRKPALATAIAGAIVIGLAGIVGILWQWRRAREETVRARVNAYEADMNLAQQALTENNQGRALELLQRHLPAKGQKDLRGWEWRYLWQRTHGNERATLATFRGAVMALGFTPDHNLLVAVDDSGSVQLWDSTSWREANRLELGAAVLSMALSPNGTLMAFGTRNNQVIVWDWRQKQQRSAFGVVQAGGHGEKIAFSPDGSTVVTGDKHGFLEVRSANDFHLIRRLTAQAKLIRALAFSRDGRLLASGGNDASVKIWDTASWEPRMTIPADRFAILGVQFSADGKKLLTCGWDALIKAWDLSSGQRIATFTGHTAPVYTAVFSPDGALVASASADQTIRVWETATQTPVAVLHGHSEEVGMVVFSQDGRTLLSGSKDRTVKLWSVPQRASDPNFMPLPKGVFAGKISSDGQFGVTYSPAGIAAWRVREREQLGQIPFPSGVGQRLSEGPFTINGGVMAFRWLDGAVRVFSLCPFQEVTLVSASGISSNVSNAGPVQLALSGDGKLLAVVSHAGEVQIQDWAAHRMLAHWTLAAQSSPLMLVADCLVFAPGGRVLAIAQGDGTVQLWGVDGRHLAKLKANEVAVEALAFSQDGHVLAAGDGYGLVRLWDLSSRRQLATLRPYIFGVQHLAFTPDGTRLAMAAGDGSIKLWNLGTYQEVLTLKAHPTNSRLAFTPDGEILVTGSVDGLRLWRAPGFSVIDPALRH